jgi:putative Holliday junction resolvase
MSIHPWPHLLKRLKKGQCLLGLDVGSTTIGVAVSDAAHKVATPLLTLPRHKVSADMQSLAELALKREAGGFIIGLPYNMDGSEGASAKRSRLFAQQMLENAGLFGAEPQISFFDERLSTSVMQDFLSEEIKMKQADQKKVIDKLAAQIILQSALDTARS